MRCARCLMPDTRPDTPFKDGVCSACLVHDKRAAVDWDARKRELEALLERHRRSGAAFDCIVPSSGGKDSHAQVLQLLDLGARPLVVTAATCYLTPIGRINIDNLARYATTIEVTPSESVRRRLNKIGLRMVGDVAWPEHVAIHTMPFRLAVQMDIPLVFYGENPLAHYGGPPGMDEARQMTRRWVSEFGGFLGLRPSDCIGQFGLTRAEMADYTGPTDAALEAAGVEVHFLGQYLPWDSHENARMAREAGMVQRLPSPANRWDFENLDGLYIWLHDVMMFGKYGYGRGCAQASVDIRFGRLEREEGMQWVKRCDGIIPERYAGVPISETWKSLDMTQDELARVMERFINRDLFVPFGAYQIQPLKHLALREFG